MVVVSGDCGGAAEGVEEGERVVDLLLPPPGEACCRVDIAESTFSANMAAWKASALLRLRA